MLQQHLPLKQLGDEMSATRWIRTLENDVEYLNKLNDETRSCDPNEKDPKIACLQSRLMQVTCERNAYQKELENACAEFNTLNVEIKRLVQNYGYLLACHCDLVSTNSMELKTRLVESRVAGNKIQSLTDEHFTTRNHLACVSEELMAVRTNRKLSSSMSVSEEVVGYALVNDVKIINADIVTSSTRHGTYASSKHLNDDLPLKRWNFYANEEEETVLDRDQSRCTRDISKAKNFPVQLFQPQAEKDSLDQGPFQGEVSLWIQRTRGNDQAEGTKEIVKQERLISDLNMQPANLKLTPCGSAGEDECNQPMQTEHARQKRRHSFIETPKNVKDKDDCIQTLQMENEILMKALDRQEAALEAIAEKLKLFEDVQVEKDNYILLVEREIRDLKSCIESLKRVEGLVNEKDECIRTLLLENEHLIDELKLRLVDLKSHVEKLAHMEILISQKDKSIMAVKREVCDLRSCIESHRTGEVLAQKKDECSQTQNLEERQIEALQKHADELWYVDRVSAPKDKHTALVLSENDEEMCYLKEPLVPQSFKDKAIESQISQTNHNSIFLLDTEALKTRSHGLDEDDMQDVSPSREQSVIKHQTQVEDFLVTNEESLELRQVSNDISHLVAMTQESSVEGELVVDTFPAEDTATAWIDEKASVSLDVNANLPFPGNAKDETVAAIDFRLGNGKNSKTTTRKSAPIALKEIDEVESSLDSDFDGQFIRQYAKDHNISVKIEIINGTPSEKLGGNKDVNPEKSSCKQETIKTLWGSVSKRGTDYEVSLAEKLAEDEFLKKEIEFLKKEIEFLKKEIDAIMTKLLELALQEFQQEEELQTKLAAFTLDKSATSIDCLQTSLNIANVGEKLLANNQCSGDRQGGVEQLLNIASSRRCNLYSPEYCQLNMTFGCRCKTAEKSGHCNASSDRAVNWVQNFGEGRFAVKDTWIDFTRTASKFVHDSLCTGMQNNFVNPEVVEAMSAAKISLSGDVACYETDCGREKSGSDDFKTVNCVMRDEIIKLKQDFAIISQRSEERLQALLLIEKYFRFKRAQDKVETEFDFSQFSVQNDSTLSTIVANITALTSSFPDKVIDENQGPLRGVVDTHNCVDYQGQLGQVLPQNDQASCDPLAVRHKDFHIKNQYPCLSCVESTPSNGEANLDALNKETRWLALFDEKRKDELKILVLDLEVKRLRKIIGMKFRAPKKSKFITKARTTGFLRMRAAKTVPEIIFFNEFNDSENSDVLNATNTSFV